MNSTFVAIALGSNLGDRRAHLDWAVAALGRLVSDLRVSPYLDTAPVGVPDEQPRYLNAVVVGQTSLTARQLLHQLLALEAAQGRTRATFRGARTLDLDIILFGQDRIDEPGLVVPHPRFRERRFVLEPLVQLAPDALDPVTGRTMSALLAALAKYVDSQIAK